MTRLSLRDVCHRAGIDDGDVRRDCIIADTTSCRRKLQRHRLRFGLVQLAADSQNRDARSFGGSKEDSIFLGYGFGDHASIIPDEGGMSTRAALPAPRDEPQQPQRVKPQIGQRMHPSP